MNGRKRTRRSPQRPRDPPRQPLGVLDHVELRNDLADRALGARDQHVREDDRDHDRCPWLTPAERLLQQVWIAGSPSAPIPIDAIVIPTWQAEM